MRIPLTQQLSSRDGGVIKDAKLLNAFNEIAGQQGEVKKRPGSLDLGLITAGVAQLLKCWNNQLRVIVNNLLFDAVIYSGNSTLVSTTTSMPIIETYGCPVGNKRIFVCMSSSTDFYYVVDTQSLTVNEYTDDFVSYSGTGTGAVCHSDTDVRVFYTDGDSLYYFTTDGVTPSNGTCTLDLEGATIDAMSSVVWTDGVYQVYLSRSDSTGTEHKYTSVDGVTFSLVGEVPSPPIGASTFKLENTWFSYLTGGTGIVEYSTSTDGVTWSAELPINVPESFDDVSVCLLGNTVYLGFGQYGATPGNNVYSSTDGINFSLFISDVLPVPGQYATGGRNAQLWASDTDLYAGTGYDVEIYRLTGVSATVTPTQVGTPSAITPDLDFFSSNTGASQSNQQLLLKNSQQGWIYTE